MSGRHRNIIAEGNAVALGIQYAFFVSGRHAEFDLESGGIAPFGSMPPAIKFECLSGIIPRAIDSNAFQALLNRFLGNMDDLRRFRWKVAIVYIHL